MFRSRLLSTSTTSRGSLQSRQYLRDRDQLVDAVHLHRAVADERDHRAVRDGRTWRRSRRARPGPSSRGRPRARPSCPRRILQVARVPVGGRAGVGVRMQSSGSRGDSSQNTRCGLIGSAVGHRARLQHLPPLGDALPRSRSRQARSVLRSSSGSSARSVSRAVADQVDLHRVAQARACAPSMSICTPRAWPSSGRNSE